MNLDVEPHGASLAVVNEANFSLVPEYGLLGFRAKFTPAPDSHAGGLHGRLRYAT